MNILFTPFPPQLSMTFTSAQLARLDRRFACPELLPLDLSLLVQDSAALLSAALSVRTEQGRWAGHPEEASVLPSVDEATWERHLLLTGRAAHVCSVEEAGFLRDWTDGLVYLFCGGTRLRRRLNLGLFCDRMEVDFLLSEQCLGVKVLRAHRLEADGTLTLWRVTC